MPEVPIGELRPAVDPASLGFRTTAEVQPHVGLIGQERAIEAIKFGLTIESKGFNICVTGEAGTGRTTAVREYLETFSSNKPPPDDWCYVNNFADPHRPRAIRLPHGKGREFRNDVAQMISEARSVIPRAFESDDFVQRRDQIISTVQKHHEEVFRDLGMRARAEGFQLQGSNTGFFLLPMSEDKPMTDETFAALPQDQRDDLLRRRDALMETLRAVMKQEQGFDNEANERLAELQRIIATNLVETITARLLAKYQASGDIVSYLNEVRADMVENIDDFRRTQQDAQPLPMPFPGGPQVTASPFRRYEVNLLIDCAEEQCATVVFESNPMPQRLFGRIEKEAVFGAVSTDFTMIRPGSLHRANGGYLVVDFDELLLYPLSWNELKRTIRTGQLTIEEMGERLGFIETKTVRPEPIPWTGKIVAIAREIVYRTLYGIDPEFKELFKVKADFELHIDRTPQHERDYAGLISALTRREKLPPMDSAGVALVIEEGMRMAADHEKLSIRFGDLTDIVREAAYWGRAQQAEVITREHVAQAIDERVHRVNLIEEHTREAMARKIIVVDTTGEEVGQVNGLSVVDLGDTAFGQPSRITATIGVGSAGIVDLQREARLSGPIHSKAVLTLQGFLVDRYAEDEPITLTARVSFEQSYGPIEGDSATVAETVALLSRIANVPVKQSLAVTGSMDQLGEVQAIGGANQKIEGFFDVCRLRGLTGEQGVVIPASNVQHLMLREDLVAAVKEGKFRIYSAATIDEAIELLTGLPAGEQGEDGTYQPESVNGRVRAALRELSLRLRRATGNHDRPQNDARKAADTDDDEEEQV